MMAAGTSTGFQEGQIPGKINKRVKRQKGALLLFFSSCADVSRRTLSFAFASEAARMFRSSAVSHGEMMHTD